MHIAAKLSTRAAFGLVAVFTVSNLCAQTVQHYTQTNLVSSTSGVAANTDPNLINPWGLSRSSGGPWWVSDNGTGLSTLYSGTGSTIPLVVTIPGAAKGSIGSPTGTVYNGTQDFQIAPGKPAAFLFATEDGTISGWNPAVSAKAAVIAVNTKAASVFKGLTMATVTDKYTGVTANFLYAADFRRGRVKVYDTNFAEVYEMEERFEIDDLPKGYAPFNVQNIGGNIYVTFAIRGSGGLNEVDGAGLGYVAAFSSTGKLLTVLDHGTYLNAPWGLAQAPSDFGAYSHDILVGQFGSGEIVAFNPLTGHLDGILMNAANQPIQISGLWGLAFGNGASSGSATALYFAAGSNGEQGGLLGSLVAVENTYGNDR